MEETKQKVHFIAIGGSVMHNLALALQNKGYKISGSDDEIVDPSKSRLEKAGLLPSQMGWFPEKITQDLDAIILGMHATIDNPELQKAKELGIKIYSFPEYIYEQSIDKQRIVITGSYGKSTITAMVIHVLKFCNRKFDYVIGSQQDEFDLNVKLSHDAPVIIIEGDEYQTSPLDKTPKFLHYNHHIGLVSGIAWDYIDIYPTFDEYVKQFELFADQTPKGGTLIYSENDDLADFICRKEREDVIRIEYSAHKHAIEKGLTYLDNNYVKLPIQIFGKHSMRNISGAKAVCQKIGVVEEMFYEAIQNFKGTPNRLELIESSNSTSVYLDNAHAPSKVKATTNAVKKQFSSKSLTAVLELYTLTSLNKDFLSQYKESFKSADEPIVFFDPHTVENKKLPALNSDEVKKAFNNSKLQVFTDKEKLKEHLLSRDWKSRNLLLMSCGNFCNLDLKELAKSIVKS